MGILWVLIGPICAYFLVRKLSWIVGADPSFARALGVTAAILWILFFVKDLRLFIKDYRRQTIEVYPNTQFAVGISDGRLLVKPPGHDVTGMALTRIRQIAVLSKNFTAAGPDIWWRAECDDPEDGLEFPSLSSGADKVIAFFGTLPKFDKLAISSAEQSKVESSFSAWRREA
jgi:hypothetical protein